VDAIAVAQENRRGPAKVAHLTEKHARLAEVAEREAEYTELMYRRCGRYDGVAPKAGGGVARLFPLRGAGRTSRPAFEPAFPG
jgi:hypothetical protein